MAIFIGVYVHIQCNYFTQNWSKVILLQHWMANGGLFLNIKEIDEKQLEFWVIWSLYFCAPLGMMLSRLHVSVLQELSGALANK